MLRVFSAQCESWYAKHRAILKDSIPFRNPLILYNNHPDFQQTTAIMGEIGAGTGGVTEGLKNRVVLPLLETRHQSKHVLGHELVHAFQYSLMREADSVSIYTADVPLWMVEGMAEYMSIGNVDSHTAMWMRDAVQNNDVPTTEAMSRDPRYFPYRYGQAFWAYVAGTWTDTIIRPLFMHAAKSGYRAAIKKVLGIPVDSLDQQWKRAIIKHYAPYQSKTMAAPNAHTLINESNGGYLNVSPSVSPDGKYVAFFSEKDVFSVNLFVAETESGKVIRTLTKSRRTTDVDELSFLESGGAWSPDSKQFAYVVFEKGKNLMYVIDVGSGTIIKKVNFPGLESFSNPAWSPDGRKIAVAGLSQGVSDIYIYETTTGAISNFTSDPWSDIQPSWANDGKTIVFASDRPATDNRDSSNFKLCLLDLSNRSVTILPVFKGAENVNPVFGSSDSVFYFLSNADGFRNIYRYSIKNKTVDRLTNLFTGVSGITQLSPALSVARNSNTIVFSHYNNKRYTISYSNEKELFAERMDPRKIDLTASSLPPASKKFQPQTTVDEFAPVSISPSKYKSKFKLDFIGNAGVGVIAGRYGAGLAGGVNALFGDIVGNNQLFTALSMNGRLQDISGAIAYAIRKIKSIME